MRVLVVEDNEVDSTLFRILLELSGHTVEIAPTADSAIVAIRECTPDIVLLDLSLPDASGVTLVRRLRAEPAIEPVPILAVSAYSESFPRNVHLAAGCDAYLTKPCDTRTLVRQVEELRRQASC
ncbi:MAG: response regulator [Proteobacteria bacterium]|nr:response regulator [Pseudomonadota bacterium]